MKRSYIKKIIAVVIGFLAFIILIDLVIGDQYFVSSIDKEYLFVLGALVMFYFISRAPSTSKKTHDNMPPVSKEKEHYYLAQGLTPEDVTFFRETMNEARLQILQLEAFMEKSPRLNTINHRYKTVETAKNFFQVIVKNPRQLAKVNEFLYRDLPDVVSLSQKFLDIEAHPNKNKATLHVIEKSIEKIEQLCQVIEEHYLAFCKEELIVEDHVSDESFIKTEPSISKEMSSDELPSLESEEKLNEK
ncbi:5-bromo-4-chloroindolyl phosphate hydrolysis family protein [Allofustis seminis]|uniref:5-bromo-4-chloroindolyl phosphate hydrolysis family protein n=1 Tax=Allofustis seminis TaxID=166939 RepID=UPI000360A2F5|nr:5-bromo-4-chloroindolyl phosphate hydrolysis family protein [Allofustis seminis]